MRRMISSRSRPSRYRPASRVWSNPATALHLLKRNLVLLVPLAPLVLVWIIGRGPRPGDGWAHTRVIWKRYADNPVFSPPEAMARVFT